MISKSSSITQKRAVPTKDAYELETEPSRCSKQSTKRPDDESPLRLACPYRKHNPRKYNIYTSRPCALSNWPSVSRVKEHLYRVHRAPIQCQRCGTIFKTEIDLTSHVKLPIACDSTDYELVEGITRDMEKDLRSRKRSKMTQSDPERWTGTYSLLFPNEKIPDPFFETVYDDHVRVDVRQANLIDFDDYESYSGHAYPELIRSTLKQHQVQDAQIETLVDALQGCHKQFLSSYKSKSTTFNTASVSSESSTVQDGWVSMTNTEFDFIPDMNFNSDFNLQYDFDL